MKKLFKISFSNILIWIVLLLSVTFQFLSLTKIFNFEYSFLFSIILFIAAGVLTVHYLRKFKTFGMLPAIMRMKYKEYFILLLAPFVMAVVSNLLFQICPLGEGIIYYAVIVIPAFYFGIVIGAFSFWSSNKKYAYLIFAGIFLLFALAPLLEFYIYPQVYFYNVIVGIIPGTIYDEEILIGSKLIFYRIVLIILFTILLYGIFKIGTVKRNLQVKFILFTSLFTLIFFLFKPQFGWATTENILKKNLNGECVTDGVTIRYTDNLTKKQVRLLKLKHKYYLQEISRKTDLSTTPKGITSYVFKNAEQKGVLFGSKAANVAKPWMKATFIDFNSVDETLEHELTHLFAAQIGSTPFKIADNFNMAMLEGYAMAIENNYAGYDIHYMALLAKSSGYNFNIPQLFSKLNFFGQASSLSYITAGSFVKFLIETYGIDKVNLLYQDLDFEKYIGKNLEELSSEYSDFLDSLGYRINEHRARLFFGRRPITKKVCPRTVASDLNSAWNDFGNGEYHSAREKFLSVWNYSASYSALLGVIYSDNKLALFSESLKLLKENIDKYKKTSSYYSALLSLGDAFSLNGDFSSADSVYLLLAKLEPTVRYKNLAEIRSKLISEKIITDYLTGSDFDKYRILKKLNEEELFDFSLPIMIELSRRLHEKSKFFVEIFDGKNPDVISGNTAFELSKYFTENLEFEKANRFADLSIAKCKSKFMLPILKAHKKMLLAFLQ